MNNVLVTGASGLIGGILNTKLTEHNLFGVDIKKCDYENFEISINSLLKFTSEFWVFIFV